jgi:hypothetical protein
MSEKTQPRDKTTQSTDHAPQALADSSRLLDQLLALRSGARRRLLMWTGIFVGVFIVVLLVVSIQDLRQIDALFLPSLFMLVIVSVIYGYVIGSTHAVQDCLTLSQKEQRER